MSDYPRVLYHTSIKRIKDAFGHVVEGTFVHNGDLANPSYPIPCANANDLQTKGQCLGGLHLVAKHHYKTMIVAVYNPGGDLNEELSKAEEERLAKDGWVRHPDMLKEEYED